MQDLFTWKTIISIQFVAAAFTLLNPIWYWKLPSIIYIAQFAILIFTVIVWSFITNLRIEYSQLGFVFFACIIFIYLSFPRGMYVNLQFGSVFLIIFLALSSSYKSFIVKLFFKCYVILLVISFGFFILGCTSILPPIGIITAASGRQYFDFILTSLIIHGDITIHYGQFIIGRFQGILNEPGYLGTINALLIIANRYASTKTNLILLCTGIATLSLAFVILFTFAAIFFLSRKSIITFTVISTLLAYILSTSELFFRYFNKLMISRFSFDTFYRNGMLSRDTADTHLKIEQHFSQGTFVDILFGSGDGFSNANSIFMIIVDFGIIGLLLMVIFVILIPLQLKERNYPIVFMTALMLSALQRPYLLQIEYVLLIFYATSVDLPMKLRHQSQNTLSQVNRVMT